MILFDASTLILTAKMELLDLFLESVSMAVVVPGAVERECCGDKKTFDALIIQKALDESRIKVKGVRDRKQVTKLEEDFSMGRGEPEAIALALQEKAMLVAIDDKRGINACKLAGIPFTTAIGILIRSRENGLIDRSGALVRLTTLARNGRYRKSILEDAKRRLEQHP
jgi:predicted nucleic acid-binding protein